MYGMKSDTFTLDMTNRPNMKVYFVTVSTYELHHLLLLCYGWRDDLTHHTFSFVFFFKLPKLKKMCQNNNFAAKWHLYAIMHFTQCVAADFLHFMTIFLLSYKCKTVL